MGTKEQVTAKLKGRMDEAKRTIYVFEDPLSPDREKKYSAFEPNLPELRSGQVYTFTVEHVDAGNGKQYHNLFRKDKTSAYEIAEAKQTSLAYTQQAAPAQPVRAQTSTWADKLAFDRTRLEFDQKRNAEIRRVATLNSAIALIEAAKGASGLTLHARDVKTTSEGKCDAAEVALAIATLFDEYVAGKEASK